MSVDTEERSCAGPARRTRRYGNAQVSYLARPEQPFWVEPAVRITHSVYHFKFTLYILFTKVRVSQRVYLSPACAYVACAFAAAAEATRKADPLQARRLRQLGCALTWRTGRR